MRGMASLFFKIMINSDVDRLNVLLAERYGKTISGGAHFRIVWSEDIFETRVGYFNEFSGGGIYLRSYYGAKRSRKYNYIKDRWILEMWKQYKPLKECPEPDFYEPIFVFENSKGESLPPIWAACEYACQSVLNPPRDKVQREQDMEDFFNKRNEDEKKYFYDMFDITPISSLLHTKEAISIKKGLN